MKNPSGSLLLSTYFNGGNVGRKTLPETGAYTIIVGAGSNEPSLLGAYSFALTAAGDTVMTLAIGDSVSDGLPAAGAGKLEVAGAEDRYMFQGTAGESVVFEQLDAASAFAGWLRWEIKSPSGQQLLVSFFQKNRSERKTLPETGSYTIRVWAAANDPSYIGVYSFRTYIEVFANPDSFATTPGKLLAMPMSKFLCNDQHISTDIVDIDLPVSTTVQGGTLFKSAGAIVYTPQPGFSGTDSFEYILRGQFGGTSATTVTVHVFEGADVNPTVVSTSSSGNATVKVCLLGEPGQIYNVHQSVDFGVWTKLDTITADATGAMIYAYQPDPAGMRFYRFSRQ